MIERFTKPSPVYRWARNLANQVSLEKVNLLLETFVNEFEVYPALFHDEESNQTLCCAYDLKRKTLTFWQIMNFTELVAKHQDLVNLYLRNGEYLYQKIQGAKTPKAKTNHLLS